MTREIVFPCLTDPVTGYGHLSRCITLANGLRKKGYKIIFLTNQNSNAIKELKKNNFTLEKIPHFSSKNFRKHDPKHVLQKMKSKGWKTIVVDMRNYGEKISKFLKNKEFRVILLDDAWCKKPNADLIINGTIVKKFHAYKKVNPYSKFFNGTKFWILNSEFSKHKKKISEINKKKKYRVIVSMGGSNNHNLTSLVVKSITNIPNVLITIIIGPFFNNVSKLNYEFKNNTNIQLVNSPNKIWKEFQKSDLAISNPGNTLYELCTQQIPTICITAELHQLSYAKIFSRKGFSENLGSWKEVNNEQILQSVISLLNNTKKRKKMCLAAKKIMDGKGLNRVVNIIDNFLKNNQGKN